MKFRMLHLNVETDPCLTLFPKRQNLGCCDDSKLLTIQRMVSEGQGLYGGKCLSQGLQGEVCSKITRHILSVYLPASVELYSRQIQCKYEWARLTAIVWAQRHCTHRVTFFC
jgi:hypothetical protein